MRMARYWPLVAAMLLATLLVARTSPASAFQVPASDPISGKRIYLDPGHGVSDRGGIDACFAP